MYSLKVERVLVVSLVIVYISVLVGHLAMGRLRDQSLHPQVAGVVSPPESFVRGDCNGDGVVDAGDLSAVSLEIDDGDGNLVQDVGGGSFAGTAACDANSDGIIDSFDTSCITGFIFNNVNPQCLAGDGCVADINQDGIVDISDYLVIVQYFRTFNPPNARVDISDDGFVDISDYAILSANFLKKCVI